MFLFLRWATRHLGAGAILKQHGLKTEQTLSVPLELQEEKYQLQFVCIQNGVCCRLENIIHTIRGIKAVGLPSWLLRHENRGYFKIQEQALTVNLSFGVLQFLPNMNDRAVLAMPLSTRSCWDSGDSRCTEEHDAGEAVNAQEEQPHQCPLPVAPCAVQPFLILVPS